MNLSIEQSYFGRNLQNMSTNTDLKRCFRRNVAAVIEYCHLQAKRIKPRNQYQAILFPLSYEDEVSEEVSHELKNQYQKQASYPFYLSRCNLFIDNHHLKIMRKASPIALKFDCLGYGKLAWFAEWLEVKQKNFLIGVTTNNWVLIISLLQRNFNKYLIFDKKKSRNKEIVAVNVHTSYLFVFSEDQFHILQYNVSPKQDSKLEVVVTKQYNEYKISKGYGVFKNNKFYIFLISTTRVLVLISEEGILSKIDFREVLLYARIDSNILNFNINLKSEIVTCVISTKEEITVLNYLIKNEMSKVLFKKQNDFRLWSQNYCLPYLDFIQRQSYLLVVIGLRQRLYFIKTSGQSAEISKRIKFRSTVQYVSEIGRYPGIVVVLKNLQSKKQIIITHQNKLISYSGSTNIQLIDKYQLYLQLEQISNKASFHRTLDLYKSHQILFINSSSIQRVVINKWQDIYNQMKITQNIQLLKYLILLQYCQSPFLKRPDSFESLQNFFFSSIPMANYILLEYYYIMNLHPQKIIIMQNPTIMIPFILQHKIINLSDDLQIKLMEWCLKKDERLVQEMIIGGAECGWKFAIKKGWIRAFKVMVKSGMQIQMPILKLYSMAILQRSKIVNQKTEEISQQLSLLGHKYILQLIQYVIFVFENYMKDFEGEENIIELKQLISLVFKDEFWRFLVKFQPKLTIPLLTFIFINQGCIQAINNSFTPQDISGFNRFFGPFLKINYSYSETILSHLSFVFNEQHPELSEVLIKQHTKLMLLKYYQQKYNLNTKFGREVDVSLKSITLVYQIMNNKNFSKAGVFELLKRYKQKVQSKRYFSFKKEYLKQMLKSLIKDSAVLQNIYRDLSSLRLFQFLKLTQDELEQDMNDFLVYIWIEIYLQILENLQRKQPQEIKRSSKQEIASFYSDIQVENYKFQYLGVHLMLSINYLNEQYTLKIFQKYFKCGNPLIKFRIFEWLTNILHSLPAQSNVRINLQEQIIRKLKDLIQIDKQQARLILQQFFEDRQKQIIKKIDNDPDLQLQYVELIIKKGRDGEPIQSYYISLHIKLILQLKPEELVNLFSKNSDFADYNIAEALTMTQSAQNFESKLDILMFLYERDGQIMKCIETYLQRLERLAFLFIETLEKSKDSQSLFNILEDNTSFSFNQPLSSYPPQLIGLIEEFTIKFEESINLIYRQIQVKYQFIKKYLDKLVQILVLILSQNYKFKKDYIIFISTSIGNFIFKMVENNCLWFLSQWIKEYPGKFQFFTNLKHYFIEVFDKVLIHRVILNKMADIQKKTLVSQIKQALKLIQFSISSTAFCHVCQQSFTPQSSKVEVLLFSCGHIYHKCCIQQIGGEDFCFYCVSKNQFKSMIEHPQLDLVQLLKSYRELRKKAASPDFKIDIKQRETIVSLKQKRNNRLGLFDKKVSTIETQAEIIDMKLLIQEYYSNQNKK